MRFHNSDKESTRQAEMQCHSEPFDRTCRRDLSTSSGRVAQDKLREESIKAFRTRGFFVVPPTVGLLRMTGRNRFSRWAIAGTILIVCFLLLGGCLGKGTQKATRFYLLQPISGISSGERASVEGEGVMLAIGPVRVREYLNRPQIVTRIQENKIMLHDFHSWGEPLDKNFTAVLGGNLSNLLSTDRIVFFPWRERPNFDYQIVVDVMRFDGDLGEEALLIVHYYISTVGESEGEERGIIGTWKSSFNRQTRDDSFEALVAAMSELVGDFSREIAEKIKDASR